MMQSLDLHRTHARPAAVLALPGTRPSCAVEPRVPGFFAPCAGNSGRAATGSLEGIRSGGIPKIKQDRRYERDQRGRAVACA